MERNIVLKDGRAIKIRPLARSDAEASHAFFTALPEEERRYLRRDVTRRSVIEERIRENDLVGVERLVAVHDDAIVADGSFEHEPYGWGERIAQIRLIVAPDFRRSGLGTALARLLYVIAHQHDVARINVRMLRPQAAARDIFRQLGFREEYVLPDHVRDLDGKLQDLILMRCDLSMLSTGRLEETRNN
jgi:GNAT superfamily N-acetyltransferase